MMSGMTSRSFLGSVTALLVLEDMDRILIGTGSFLEMYDLAKYELLQRLNLFNDTTNTIQGFCRKEMSTTTMVYGGKTIKVIRADVEDENMTSFSLLQSITLCDWIMAVNWREESIWAISAHNHLFYLMPTICKFEKEVTIHCQDEKCILYSACLINDAKEVVVIGGTVFRQVIVWGSSSGQVYHRLTGHDGVIFSVAYSIELNLLCSTSDDRSLRLWKVSFAEGSDSGFKSSQILPSHTLDNIHQARVFRCLFLSSKKIVVSGGEDSAIAFWDVTTGQLLGKKNSKSGSIWSLANYKSQVISGTGNGTVKVLRCPKQKLVDQVPLTDLISTGDCPRIVKFWQRQIVILTLKGCLISVIDSKRSLILQDDDLASYALMEMTHDKLYFATIQGKIKWISLDNYENKDHCIHEERISDGKIFALAYLAKSKRILTCIKDGVIQIHQELVDLNQIQKVGQLVLPFTKDQRWFSSVAEMQHLLLVGDRCGHLHVFDTTKNNILLYSERAHNRQGIGFIQPLTEGKFLTGGRDGKVKTFLHDGDDKFHLSSVQHLQLPWLERCIEDGRSMIVCGFHSTHFVVHSLEDDKTIASIPCGGGHRSWDFNGTDLCFVKDKEVLLASDLDKEITITRGAGHLKEINCIEHLRFDDAGDDETTRSSFLVTGGEDTSLKIWSLTMKNNLSCLSTYRRHASSIKCLATKNFSSDGRQKILVSAGGRAELRLWQVKWLPTSSSKVSCIEVAHHFLKGNDKQRLKTWRDHDLIDDTEPAFLSVAISVAEEAVSYVFVSCSDGVVRRWSFDMDKRSLEFLSQSDVFPNAMLKILKLSSSGMILAADTAGRLRVFDAQLQRKNVVENVHQNGINALLEIKNGKVVISGGDDGHICRTNIEKMARDDQAILAHASPITRLNKIHNGFCSVSVDQRITYYVSENFDFKFQCFSHCPDVADAVVIEEGKKFIVVGNAIEVFALEP